MTHSEFVNFVINTLGEEVLDREGAALYSSFPTIKKSKFYIIGLNPGGNDEEMTIKKSLHNIKDLNFLNEYLNENWNPNGKHRLQENIRIISEKLRFSINQTPSTNLIFERSVGQNTIDLDNLNKYLKIQEILLKIIQPEIIISFGNGNISPFNYLQKIIKKEKNLDDIPASGHGNYKIKGFIGKLNNFNVKVIGLPHLSKYSLNEKNDNKINVLNWMKSQCLF